MGVFARRKCLRQEEAEGGAIFGGFELIEIALRYYSRTFFSFGVDSLC